MNIGSIVWPKDRDEANKLYLGFLIAVVKIAGITFEDNDPVTLAKEFINGNISENNLKTAASKCWAYIEGKEGMQDFQENEILMARLALCFLVLPKDISEFGDYLSWFFEVLGFLHVDLDRPLQLMEDYFLAKR